VGMNLFVINSMSRGTTLGQTYAGVLPFIVSDFLRTVVLVAFPAVTLFLVHWLY
jgi:C4-dicarboxylate transporter, DctM subunit